jgi:hypothetical protein
MMSIEKTELSLDELESEALAELPTREALSRRGGYQRVDLTLLQIAEASGPFASASNSAVIVIGN